MSLEVFNGLTVQGAFTLDAKSATYVLAGPVSGDAAAPTFRALAATDIPALAYDATGTAAGLLSGHTTTYDHTLLHAPVTLGTANGLSLTGQELSLPTTAAPTFAGLTVDSMTIAVDSVNHRLGVGISAPTSLLHVGPNAGIGLTAGLLLTPNLSGGGPSGYDRTFEIAPLQTVAATGNSTLVYVVPRVANGVTQPDMFGFLIDSNQGPGSVTSYAGLCINYANNNLGATNGTCILLGQIAIPSGSYGLYDATNSPWYIKGKIGVGVTGPNEAIEVAGKIRANTAFNLNGTDGVTQAAAAGKVSDVTALAGGIATAQTQITYIADGAHSLVGITSITTANGRITAMA